MRKYRFFAVLLLLLLLTQCILPAAATPSEDVSQADISEETAVNSEAAPEEDGSSDGPTGFTPPEPLTEHNFQTDYQAQAKAALLLDLNSNTILYAQAPDEQIYPASLTKIMTCMLALEYGNLDDILTVSPTALENLSEYGSTANLKEGEQITLRELLYCVMVSSANEGCNVVAEYISGDVASFVTLMNTRAKALGMTGTHFANAHGLHDDAHYTTVRDLAILASWAWQDPTFREFATTKVHTVPATNLSDARILHTTNYLVSTEITTKYYYEKASGIKTGFTTPAGGCLISTAASGDLSFLSIVCGCETLTDDDGSQLDMRFVETKRLLEFAFENYAPVQVLSSTTMLGQPAVLYAEGRESVVVHAAGNATVLLPADCKPEDIQISIVYDSTQALEAPLEEGQRVGTVTAMYQGIPLASSELVTLTAVERSTPKVVSDKAEEAVSTIGNTVQKYWYLVVPLVLVLLLLCILLIVRAVNIRKEKKRAERRRRREELRRKYDE